MSMSVQWREWWSAGAGSTTITDIHRGCPPVPPRVMWLSIVSPTTWAIAGTYSGIYRILCPPQTRDLPRAYAGRYFHQKARKSTTPGCQHMPGLWPMVRGVVGLGPNQGFTRKMSPAVLGSTRGCTLDITKYKVESPGKSPLSPICGGPGLQLIAA